MFSDTLPKAHNLGKRPRLEDIHMPHKNHMKREPSQI